MSDKVYLGQNVSDLDYDEKLSRISRVNLSVDSDHIYTSGDDTGRTLEASCPWGSQAMADSILAKVSGIDYQPYEASDALLDQAAEIGDGITLGGVYSVLAQSSISLDKQCAANISAPYNDEIDDEYPYKTPEQRKSERQLAYARSLITKTSEEIRLEVSNELDGLSSSIDVKLGSITTTIQGLNKKISTLTQTDSEIRAEITDQINGLSSSIDVKLDSITSTVQGINGKISTLEQTDSEIRAEISDEVNGLTTSFNTGLSGIQTQLTNSVSGLQSQIDQKIGSISMSVTNGEKSSTITMTADGTEIASEEIKFTGNVVFSSDLTDGETIISGDNIKTGKISADLIKLGGYMDLYESLDSDTVSGRFGKTTITVSGEPYEAIGFSSLSNEAMLADGILFQIASRSIYMVGTTGIIMNATKSGAAVAINAAGIMFNGSIIHYSSSDKTAKKNIRYDRCDEMVAAFDSLKPVTFDMEQELMEGQHHIGFIAQDVEEAMQKAGLPNTLTALDNRGKYVLNYGEMVALLTAKIKQLEKRLEALSA